MTKKEFIYALSRGLGSAYIAVRKNPEKYKKEVACLLSKCPAFDAQCEGTRSYYSYSVFRCYKEPEYFRDIIIKRFDSLSVKNRGWNTAYYAEVLVYFACDGDELAKKALFAKYKKLYNTLLKKKRLPNGVFPERDNFEYICNALRVSQNVYDRIATDIGKLFFSNKIFDGGSFGWFACNSQFKRLARKKSKNKYQSIFVNAVNEYEAEMERARRERLNDPIYLAERDERRKRFLERELFKEISLPTNESDLLKLLNVLGTDKHNENCRHSFHSDIFTLLRRKNAPIYVKAALPIIYSTTRCSYCREKAFTEMARHRMLTETIIEECLYVCNSDIVRLAKRKRKRFSNR